MSIQCSLVLFSIVAFAQNHAQMDSKAGTTTFLGACPRTYVPYDFNITEFMGSWYQLARYGYFRSHHKCVEVNFTYSDTPCPHVHFSVGYNFAHIIQKGLPLKWIDVHEHGIAKIQEKSGTKRKWLIKTEQADNFDKDIFPFWILSTDYKNYAIVWSCRQHRIFFNQQFAWVLVRNRTLNTDDPDHVKEKILRDLKAYGYQPFDFIITNQTSCSA